MPQLLRYVLVCIVLLAGLALASPFRKVAATSESERKTPAAEENLVLRADDVESGPPEKSIKPAREGVQILEIVTSDDVVAGSLSRLPALDVGQAVSNTSKRTETAQLRSLPSIKESVKRLPSITEYRNQREAKQTKSARLKRTPSIQRQYVKKARPRRYTVHRIVDGDDLKSLAANYLQNADRHLEIFELNRGVIRHPDVLPLHSEIKIPVE